MKIRNVYIVGTSHIAKQSVEDVRREIKRIKPHIVAIELDKRRLAALLQNKKLKIRLRDIRRLGLKGFLFNLVGAWLERKLGKLVGTRPGAEMLEAVDCAKRCGASIALIDRNIEETLTRLSEGVGWFEKVRFFADIFLGLVFRKFAFRQFDKKIDLSKVPSKTFVKKATALVRRHYPNIYRILIMERDAYIAKRLFDLIMKFPGKRILAVIGAGHVDAVLRTLGRMLKRKKYIRRKRISRRKRNV